MWISLEKEKKRKEKKRKEKSATESFSLLFTLSFGFIGNQDVLLNLKVLRCCMCLVLLLWRKPFFLFSLTLIGIELHFQYAFLSWYHIHSWMVLLTMSEPFIVDTCSSYSNTVVMVFGELSVLSHWQSSHCFVALFSQSIRRYHVCKLQPCGKVCLHDICDCVHSFDSLKLED